MAEERGKSDAAGAARADSAPQPDRSPALAANWEERVAAARKKRAQILASRKDSVPGHGPEKTAGRPPAAPPGSGASAPENPPVSKETTDIAPEILAADVPPELMRDGADAGRTVEDSGKPVPVRDPLAMPVATVSPVTGDPSETSQMPVFRHPSDDRTPDAPRTDRNGVRGGPLAARVPPADPGTRLRAFSGWLEETSAGVRIAVVAFACCFGLGFGMVMSFGILAALGWISPTGPAPAVTRSAPQVLSEAAPDVLTRSVTAMLAPLTVPGIDGLSTPGIADHEGFSDTPPPLADAAPKDFAPSRLLTRGPLIRTHTSTLTDPDPVRGRTDQLARAADELAYTARAPSRPGGFQDHTDELPVLAERGKIVLWAGLAPMRVPTGEVTGYAVPDAVISSTAFLPSPRLPGPSPGSTPVLQTTARVLPAAFTDNIASGLPAAPQTAMLLHDSTVIAPAPVIRPPGTSVLYTPQSIEPLPQVGKPVERSPTLAAQLGLTAAEQQDISLVTFAPDNVGDREIAQNLSLLEETGLPSGILNRVSFRVSRTHIRYYHPEDALVARAIAQEVGGPARDFTGINSPAPPGRIEVWMTGDRIRTAQPAQRQRRAPAARTPTAAERQAAARERLRNQLVNKLREQDYK